MKHPIFLFAFIVLLGLMGCKNSQKSGGTVSPPADGTARLSVSFFSIGSGINHESLKAFEAKILDFNKQYKVELKHDIVHWGREGETDYCFALTELKAKDADTFIAETKQLLEGKEHVRITENVACRKPRP